MPLIPAQQCAATYSQPGFLAQSSSSHAELLFSQLSSPAPVCPSLPPMTPGANSQVCVFLRCQKPCAVLFGDWLFLLQQTLCGKSLSMFPCWLHSCSSQVCVPERATLDMGTVFQPCISWILLKWQRKWRCQVMGVQSNIGSRKGFSFTVLNKNI